MQRNYFCAKWPALLLAALAGMAAAHAQTAMLAGVQRTVLNGQIGIGLAADAAGNIYYSRQDEPLFYSAVKVAPDGSSTGLIGGMNFNQGIAVDTSGNVYATDYGHGSVLRFGPGGTQVVTSGLSDPWGVAVDPAGNLYICERGLKQIVKLAPDGSRTLFGGWQWPFGVAADRSGNIYVADKGNGVVVRIAPDGSRSNIGGQYSQPWGVAVDPGGNIFVADYGSRQVVKVSPDGTANVVLSGIGAQNVAVDGNGNLFVADPDGHRVVALMRSGNVGTANVCASGQTSPQPCSQSATLTFAVTSGGTMGTPQVLADGAPNSNFNITGSTCSGAVAAGTCDVNVSFNPLTPGLRRGAVQLTDGNGNPLASALLFGTGVAPRIGFGMGAASTITSNVAASQGLAVDGNGNLYSSAFSTVVRIANGKAATFASGLNGPQAIAVDGAGDLYVADARNGRIAKVSASGAVSDYIGGLSQPSGIAVDGDGTLFVTDGFQNSLTKYRANGGTSTVTTSLSSPSGVALDAAGNVYVADTANNRIVKIAADGSLSEIGSAWANPRSVVVDAAGNVIASDAEKIARVAPDGTQTVLLSGANITAIALDSAGTLYVSQNAVISKYVRTAPPSLTFPETHTGVQSATQTVILENIGNAPLYTSPAADPSFPLSPGSGTPADCAPDSLVQPGKNCALTVGFRPSLAGSIAGAIAVSSNSLNANYQTDSISLAGQGVISNQTITFDPVLDQHAGDALPLSASASSGLAVTYTSLTPAVCSVSGSSALMLASGTCSIQASQPGNGGYTPAAPVTQSFNVTLKSQTITFSPVAAQTVGGTPSLTASSDSGLPVSFASTTPTICSVSGTTATMLAGGTCTIQASQAGNTQYSAATPVTQSFNVAAKTQTITFAPVAAQTVGGTLSLTASSDSGLAVSFASTTPAICSVSGTTATMLAAGTCSIQASQAGNSQYSAATPISQSFNVASKTQTITFAPVSAQTVGGSVSLTASSTSGLAVSFASNTPATCSVSGTTATMLAAGTCSIQASQAGNSQYSAATPVTQSFNVGLKSQSITFGAIPAQTVGGSVSLTASSTSGLAVSFASNTPAICSVSGTTATMLAAGTCTIQASQAGNSQYAAATPATQSFSVNAIAQADFTITPLPAVQNVVLGNLTGFVLQLQSVQNFNGNVTLSCSGGPAGSKCADLPQTVRVNGTALAVSGILFPKGTPKGTYTMSFTGVSGALKHTATAQFVVK